MITGDTVDAVEVLALSACVPSTAAEKFIGSHQHKRWRQHRKLHAKHTIVAYMHTCCVIMVLELQAFTDADVMMTSWQARMAEVNDVKKIFYVEELQALCKFLRAWQYEHRRAARKWMQDDPVICLQSQRTLDIRPVSTILSPRLSTPIFSLVI